MFEQFNSKKIIIWKKDYDTSDYIILLEDSGSS